MGGEGDDRGWDKVRWHHRFLLTPWTKACQASLSITSSQSLLKLMSIESVMSLLFNMLSRLVIAFLPRSKRLLISWLWSLSAVILEPPKIKSLTVFHCFLIYLLWSDGTRCHNLSFLNFECAIYVCVYICVYMYIYVCVYLCVCVFLCICVYVNVCVYLCVCVQVYM